MRIFLCVLERCGNSRLAEEENEERDTRCTDHADHDSDGRNHAELAVGFGSIGACKVSADNIVLVVIHRFVRNVVSAAIDNCCAAVAAPAVNNGSLDIISHRCSDNT